MCSKSKKIKSKTSLGKYIMTILLVMHTIAIKDKRNLAVIGSNPALLI
jgi:hypothetical protein